MDASLTFTHVQQLGQEIGGDTPHMKSLVVFDLQIGRDAYQGLHAVIKQIAGGDYDTDPLEVGPPMTPEGPYRGPFNHHAFREAAERYYRRALKFFIGVSPGSHVVMNGNLIQIPAEAVVFEVTPAGGW